MTQKNTLLVYLLRKYDGNLLCVCNKFHVMIAYFLNNESVTEGPKGAASRVKYVLLLVSVRGACFGGCRLFRLPAECVGLKM